MSILRPVRRTRLLYAVLALALVVVAAYGARVLTRDEPTRFSALFTATVGLYPGSEVRVLGLPVGTVTAITPEGTQVRVDMEVDGGQPVAPDTGAAIVAPTLVSDRYVQLTEPWTSGASIADGTVIPVAQTATPVEVDELYGSLDDITTALGPDGANADGALSDLLTVGADNLAGNGKDLNTLIRELGQATGTLSGSDEDLFATVTNLAQFNDTLVANDRGVAKVNAQLDDVTGYLAEDRGDLQRAVDNLGAALAVVDDFIRDNRGNLTSSVTKLIGPTRTLVRQRESLEETVRVLPVALQNFLRAYNPATRTLDSRANLNELSLWAGQLAAPATGAAGTKVTTGADAGAEAGAGAGAAAGRTAGGTAATDAPPVLLPGLEQQ